MRTTRSDGYRVFLASALVAFVGAAQSDHEAVRRGARPVMPSRPWASAPEDSTVLVAKLAAQLGSEEYESREIASAKLQRLLEGSKCETVAAQLRRDLATATDPEAKRRLEELVKSTELPAPGDFMVAVQGALARTPIGSESTVLVGRFSQGLEKLKDDPVSVASLRALVKDCGLKEDPANRSIVAPPGVFVGWFTSESGQSYWVENGSERLSTVVTITPKERLSLSLRGILGAAAHACHIGSEASPRIQVKVNQTASEALAGPIRIETVWDPDGFLLPSFADGEAIRSVLSSDAPTTLQKRERLGKYLRDVLKHQFP